MILEELADEITKFLIIKNDPQAANMFAASDEYWNNNINKNIILDTDKKFTRFFIFKFIWLTKLMKNKIFFLK